MIFFRFKENKKTDDFAVSLADEYIKAFLLESNKPSKKTNKKLTSINNSLSNKIQEFKTDNKLSVYRKARLGNKFMWALREHGLEKELSEDITKNLLNLLN